ncbi:hypothetical protein AV530_005266 [Patagioenas fasciata monilis]|uniref:Uncharacterized protein n=1 Tax=Patagioenas fasciata monilis TaxID=372326 RepID=A0A1V4JKN5_PATFA|nr:hypothetical protein AV530_005266 [Patagioenas fasciata monilis]
MRCIRPVLRCPHAPQCHRAVAGPSACTPSDPCVLQRWQRHEKSWLSKFMGQTMVLLGFTSTIGKIGARIQLLLLTRKKQFGVIGPPQESMRTWMAPSEEILNFTSQLANWTFLLLR